MFLSESKKCLIGAVLIKIGSALLLTWGKTNVYFYSFYKQTEPDLSIAYNTLPIAIMALPIALITIFSVKIAKKVGFILHIRIATIIQCASLLIAPYMPTYLTFLIFYIFFYGIGYSSVAFPVFSCTWSHFKKSEGRVSGLLLGAYGFASVIYVIIITYISNPNNQQADLITEHKTQTIKYFSGNVAQNAQKAAQIVSYVASICCLIGGFLIRPYVETTNYNQVGVSDQKIQQFEEETPKQHEKEAQQDSSVEIDPSSVAVNDLPLEIASDHGLPQIKIKQSLSAAIKSIQFLTIVSCLSVLTLFLLTLGLNYKSYFLTKINEDFFITFVDLVALLASSFANILWGFLIDRINFKILFVIIYFVSGIGAIALPFSATDKISFFIVYVVTMMFDKGALVVTGPALIKIFGDDIGHQLFPLTYISSLVSVVVGPISQFILLKYFSFDIILYCQGSLILLVIIFIIRLNMNYQK
ncbi:unnamed protein product [Paramecium primaurelia]|uniref:Major facilitator superfamily protein n=1 Tax=Paramecium primaurelia TaxID=5886 RepID=A0A8S1JPX7_PARPR|nr:unnamed protein product [Paramecium primaurelia]